MREKMKWLEKYVPLGIDVNKQIGGFIAGIVVATLHSMWFLVLYMQARNELYIRKASGLVLMEGAFIQEFASLTKGVFLSFYVVGIVTVLCVIFFYFYHYDGSKMMYLMRRLPDKWELHKRCWTLPIAGCCITFVWMMILKMMYYAIYIFCTPSQCLPL